jgi:hypothetical protein
MRPYKFRGLDLNGNWYYGNLTILTIKVDHLEKGSYISNSVGMPFAYAVRPETVTQFTGLEDKKGKEIYESDLVLDKRGDVLEVIWKGERYWGQRKKDGALYPVRYSNELEVLGNKYQNTELLK